MMKNSKIALRFLALLSVATAAQLAAAATTYLWSGAGADMNWNTTANWTPNGSPGYADTAFFGSADTSSSATTVNNMVSVNTFVTTLTYTNSTTGTWQVTDIPAGVTLVATNVTMGGITAASSVNNVAMTDAGTFMVFSNLNMGDSGATANAVNTVNLGGLSNFVYNASGGTLSIGFANYALVNLTLAAVSNNITAGTINFNTTSASSSSTTTLTLGAGTNIINVGNFNIGAGRNTSTVQFPAGSTGGGLRIRGVAGTDGSLANLTLGYHNTSGSGSHSYGTLSLNGNTMDMQLGLLILGESDHTPTGASEGQGTLNFDTGTIYASNIEMAVTSGGNADSTGAGTITVGANATLIVGPGGLSMAHQSTSSGAASGTLTVNSGSVICSNSIFITTNGTASITMNGGTLDMVSGTIGTAALPINTLNLSSASVQLSVNGANTTAANMYGTSVSASGTTITVTSVANVTIPTTVHLISYNTGNGDPFSGLTLAPLPAGYTGSLVDDAGGGYVDLTIQPAGITVYSLLWAGAVGNTLNSSWDFTTTDWRNLANGSPLNYTNPDFVYFDDSASNATVTLTTNFMPSMFTFSNSVLNYTVSGPGSIGGPVGFIMDGYASVTLAESGGDSFTGGVVVNSGTVILDDTNSAISGGTGIANGGTLQIGNNDGKGSLPAGTVTLNGTLIFDQTSGNTVAAAISGSGSLTQNGSGRLALAANNSSFTGNVTVNAGTLALTNSGTISNSPSVTVNSAALDVSDASGLVSLQTLNLASSTLTVAMPGQQTPVIPSYVSMSGANTINVTALPPLASYPVTLTLVQTVSGISGFDMSLGSLPASSPAYAGSVSESADNTAVLLTLTAGPTSMRPSVLWVGTNNLSVTTNWSDRVNWQLPGMPTSSDNVVFADSGSGSSGTPFSSVGDGPGGVNSPGNFNNFVNKSFTIGTLTYTNVGGSSFAQNTLITNGASLTTSNLTVGSGSADFGSGATEYVTVAGTNSALNVKNTNGVLLVTLGSANTGTEQATLDMSGLGTFTASVSTFLVGVGSGSEGVAIGRIGGVVYLAQTNTIMAAAAVAATETSDTAATAVSFDIGDADGNPGLASALYLGQTNAIYADAIAVGRQKESATMEFNPNLVGNLPTPSAYFRGANASGVTTWSIGDQLANTGSGESPTGTADFTGGYVNAQVSTLYVGRASGGSAGTGTAAGTLTFDNGIFSVNTLYAGYQPTNALKSVTGTVNVNSSASPIASGTLLVSSSLNLGLTTTGGTAATGSLNINGGTANVNAIAAGVNGASSTVSLNGGSLSVTNAAGSPAAPLTTLSLTGGVLQLNPDASGNLTNIVATTITTSGTTTINIGSIVNASSPNTAVQIPLISYATSGGGTDPYPALALGTVPAGYASPSLVDDTAKQTVDLHITTPAILVPTVPPGITGFSMTNGNAVLNGTNGQAGRTYYLLATTNLALPVNRWVAVATNLLGGANFTFIGTNAVTASRPQQFYILSGTNN